MNKYKIMVVIGSLIWIFAFTLLLLGLLLSVGVLKQPSLKSRYCKELCTKGADCGFMLKDHDNICKDTCIKQIEKITDTDLKEYLELEKVDTKKETCEEFGNRVHLEKKFN